MSLLTIAQDVADEIGIARPSSLVGAADPTARRMLAAAKAAGQALYREADWSISQKEFTFTTTADEDNYALPEDFGRLIQDTAWDRNSYWQMRGGLTSAQWQSYRSGLAASPALRKRFRIVSGALAGSFLIDPVPTADGETLVFEYISAFWCEALDATGQATWAADSDESRLDQELFRQGLLWRTKRALGMPYADERLDYEQARADAIKADLALPTINLIPRDQPFPRTNIPEVDWPG